MSHHLNNAEPKLRQRVQEMGEFLSAKSPPSSYYTLADEMAAPNTVLSPNTREGKVASRLSEFLDPLRTLHAAYPNEKSIDPHSNTIENLEDQPALINDGCVSRLPPLSRDILWLSLGLIERPAVQMKCQICKLGFSSRKRQEAAAWRIHGCSHYIHTVCLRDMSLRENAELGGCPTCKSLGCQLQIIPAERREAKIARLEQALFPWKRGFC